MGVLSSIVTVIFAIICVLLVLIILLQSDKSAGMGILGGAGQSTFGSSTADIITKVTAVMVAIFMVGSLGLSIIESKRISSLRQKLFENQPGSGQELEQKKDQTSPDIPVTDKPAANDPAKDKPVSEKPADKNK